ncbi:MAG: glycosyltransferase [Anaerolineaceae bacterium]|nr:glycosyltransferase [Anaerolineaceae bacterium]
MPAYNAEATIEQTARDLPEGSCDEIILVDDCSTDRTAEIAEGLGLTVKVENYLAMCQATREFGVY